MSQSRAPKIELIVIFKTGSFLAINLQLIVFVHANRGVRSKNSQCIENIKKKRLHTQLGLHQLGLH